MRGFLQFLPLVFFILVAVSIVRNVLRVLGKVAQPPAAPRPAANFDPELSERTRRIQEEIRRKIAERRGTVAPPEPEPVGPDMEPPMISTDERAEREFTATNAAVLERQQQLADQMRALEAARVLEQRRAVQVTAALKTESESERGMLVGSRGGLLADLRDPSSLRRAFVLREVLGPPVGLR
jgi:superfamily II RNA helicase